MAFKNCPVCNTKCGPRQGICSCGHSFFNKGEKTMGATIGSVVGENPENPLEFDTTSEEIQDDTINTPDIPCITDAGWSDYVLGHFTAEEMFNGSPTVDGLRRVAELLIGEIISIKTIVVQVPMSTNDNRATVTCNVTFTSNSYVREFGGSADVYWGNCDKPFHKYPVSTAETRAEGRALRKALRLRKVVAAEEMSEVAMTDAKSVDEVDKITDNQINFLDILCRNDARGLNINVQKLVQNEYPTVYNIRDLLHSESLAIQKLLSTYQQSKASIPSELIGYIADWKKEFGETK
jgi:hypothetical protein